MVTLSRSSAEAEYRGVANVVAETAWIRNLLCELHTPQFTATLVYYDNVSTVYMSANPVQHQRTKHIEIDIHFVRDFIASGQVHVLHVPSRFQVTKSMNMRSRKRCSSGNMTNHTFKRFKNASFSASDHGMGRHGLVLSYEMDGYRVVVGLVLSYEMEGYLVVVGWLKGL
nr:NBS-containing resistance-like protein [Tanacetum cinerariifolium]